MFVQNIKDKLSKNTCETLFWLINIMPKYAGFSFFRKNLAVSFWVVHLSLTFYIYVIGTIMYNQYFAKDIMDYVNSFLNINIMILISNCNYWALFKRSSLQDVLKLVKENDDLGSERFTEEHENKLRNIKNVVLTTLTFHFVNDALIFATARVLDMDDLIIASCSGMKPLSGSLNMDLCKVVITVQQVLAIVAVATYDATLIFLTTHTTAMFDLLQLDIASISQISKDTNGDGDNVISNRLKKSINCHVKILQTVKKLQHIYGSTIGVDFWNYAMSLLIFFVLPLNTGICLKFGPLVLHNLMLFFLYCLLGQRLTTAAERIEMAIYNCGWENFSKKDRTIVLFMLKQSQKPVILYAAKVVPICIYTFANAMQMLYKFITVFKL